MKTECERCQKNLLPEDTAVFICSYECTFCQTCATGELQQKCPNCGGVLLNRPNRMKPG